MENGGQVIGRLGHGRVLEQPSWQCSEFGSLVLKYHAYHYAHEFSELCFIVAFFPLFISHHILPCVICVPNLPVKVSVSLLATIAYSGYRSICDSSILSFVCRKWNGNGGEGLLASHNNPTVPAIPSIYPHINIACLPRQHFRGLHLLGSRSYHLPLLP